MTQEKFKESSSNSPVLTGLEIAVIGMSGKFPGAGTISEFWENLKNGIESISFFTDREVEESGTEIRLTQDPAYVKAYGILEGIEYFDSHFFGYNPREADVMDPQIRLFHECAWGALEDAGYCAETYDGLIGLYAGTTLNLSWGVQAQLSGKAKELGEWAAFQLINKDFLCATVSYRLNLRGPALVVQSACSTSLVAIHMACQAVLNGECDMAMAGGVTATVFAKTGYLYREGMIFSPDGHCRAFDAASKGTVGGDGVSLVVLKRYEEAVSAGDHIYAIVKGSAINNDGVRKVGFAAPSIEGQAEAIMTAHEMAEVEPESIGYIETHGTGTELGDPVEIEALKLAFGTDKRNYCAIGSVKTNVGHLDNASGVAGFVKAVLSLYHRCIPPSIHFENPNPKIDFANSPFYVNTTLKEWKNNENPLRAGVSSFGIGGTNAHVVLEESPLPYPLANDQKAGTREGNQQLIPLSAKSEDALERLKINLENYLIKNPGLNLPDAAYTLQVGRKAFKHRWITVASSADEAAKILADPTSEKAYTHTKKDEQAPQVIFMFPGQGAQYIDMGLGLYRTEPLFREEMDRCIQVLKPLMGYDIKEILYPSPVSPVSSVSSVTPVDAVPAVDPAATDNKINQTEVVQPLIFTIEYALAKLLLAWGIEPFAMIGHSIGEYTAACLSGVLSLEEALKIVVIRGKLMQRMPGGAMLSVPLPEEELIPLLKTQAELSLAAVNSTAHCVVSGPHEVVDAFARQLQEKGYESRRLHTSHAFHSRMMEPILTEFEKQVGDTIKNKIPGLQYKYISNVTGTWAEIEDVGNPRYWAGHLRNPVRFNDGVGELLKSSQTVFIEVGPGRTLGTFVRQHKDKKPGQKIIDLIRHPKEEVSDSYHLLNKLGHLWMVGVDIDWTGYYGEEKRRRIPLPTYPFKGQRYHLEALQTTISMEQMAAALRLQPRQAPQKQESGKNSDIAQWFYVPLWKPTLLDSDPENPEQEKHRRKSKTLVLINEGELGKQLVKRLEKQNHEVTVVKIGPGYTRQEGEEGFIINPHRENDYDTLFKELASAAKIPGKIIHCWNVTEKQNDDPEQNSDIGFYSLLYLTQAIAKTGKQTGNGADKSADGTEIIVITNWMQPVTAEEIPDPVKALVRGAIQVIPRENPDISCRGIDIDYPLPDEAGATQENPDQTKLLEKTLKNLETEIEFGKTTPGRYVAYRNNLRWTQTFEQRPLEMIEAKKPLLKEKGVYLVTGGLGGIGLVLAEYLGKTLKARLILTGRSRFPGKDEWDSWLRTHTDTDQTAGKIRKIRELEACGAEILIIRADTADMPQMQQAAAQVKEKFGKVNGIIHCAGNPDGSLIPNRTREMSETVLAPKVKGTLILDALFGSGAGNKLDIMVLCSSVSSVLAPVGQVAYCSANAFLDTYAYYNTVKNNTYTVSVNWDGWQEVGMAVKAVEHLTAATGTTLDQELIMHHPLFDKYADYENKGKIFTSLLSENRHWVLREHKIMGTAILPGTAYLEMARAAMETVRDKANTGTIELREVFFQTPLIVEKDETKEVRTILLKAGDGYTFSITSRAAPGEDRWIEHATGKALITPEQKPGKFEIREIAAAIQGEELIQNPQDWTGTLVKIDDGSGAQTGGVVYGPRWNSLKHAKFQQDQAFGNLELPPEFAGDPDTYKLHPALLDVATALLRILIHNKEGYLPFHYKRIAIKSTLPARVYCRVRTADKKTERQELLTYDVTLMDEQGTELVEIEGYSMKKLDMEEPRDKPAEEENVTLVLSSPGAIDNLVFRPAARKKPGPGEVEIAIEATGLNFKEVLLALGALGPIDPGYAFGLECVGRITECGEGVEEFQPGDEVLALGASCFSRYITTPAKVVAHKPAHLTPGEAAAIPITFMTAYYALITLGRLSKGERVLIHSAAGGVGQAAVKIAQWKGAEIFATTGTKEKRAYLQNQGIQHVMNSRTLDFADEVIKLTAGKGVNVILNSLSGEFISKSISLLAPYGRFLEIGIRDMINDTQLGLRPFLKGLSYFSVALSPELPEFDTAWHELLKLFKEGALTPIPYRGFPIEEVGKAFEFMSTGNHIGKIVVTRDTRRGYAAAETPGKASRTPRENALKDGILPAEGVEVFKRILAKQKWPQVLISTTDLFKRLQESQTSPLPTLADELWKESANIPMHPRPELSTRYIAPVTPIQQRLANIWQQFLGIEPIGINDDFFELGGDSLKVMTISAKIHKEIGTEIPLTEFFNRPTIKKLAEYANTTGDHSFSPIEPIELKEYYPLSPAQIRMYMLQEMKTGNTIYNIPDVVVLEGEIHKTKLENVFKQLIQRHESLRTYFIILEGEVVQRIHDEVEFALEYYSAAGDAESTKGTSTANIIENFIRPFELSRAPLLRVGIVHLQPTRPPRLDSGNGEKEQTYLMMIDTHHIISDGSSQAILRRDFAALYEKQQLPLLKIQYKDYSENQATAINKNRLKTQEEYWLDEFKQKPPLLSLPTDFSRPGIPGYKGKTLSFELDKEETAGLKKIAANENVSLFGLILAILNIFLAKITGKEDITVGTQIAGRQHADLQNIVGVFLNPLVLRNYPQRDKTFDNFLKEVMARTLKAYDNQEYPFEDLVEKVIGKRETNRNPMFDVMLVWQNFEQKEIAETTLKLKPYTKESKSHALIDISLYGGELDGKLWFDFEYSSELFKEETSRRFIAYFKEIVSGVLLDQKTQIKDIRISHELGAAKSNIFQEEDNEFGF